MRICVYGISNSNLLCAQSHFCDRSHGDFPQFCNNIDITITENVRNVIDCSAAVMKWKKIILKTIQMYYCKITDTPTDWINRNESENTHEKPLENSLFHIKTEAEIFALFFKCLLFQICTISKRPERLAEILTSLFFVLFLVEMLKNLRHSHHTLLAKYRLTNVA